MAVMTGGALSLPRLARWGLILLVVPYAAFAISLAGAEALHQVGSVVDVKERSAPIFFIVHALAGTAALIAGALQWVPAWRARTARVHRMIGGTYVVGVLISGVTALRMAVTFQVPLAARFSFGALAVLWSVTTVIGLHRILTGAAASHRSWMTRSYALTLFFITGPIGMAVAESGVWPYETAYPVAVSLAWIVNLTVAEAWLRWRASRDRKRADGQEPDSPSRHSRPYLSAPPAHTA